MHLQYVHEHEMKKKGGENTLNMHFNDIWMLPQLSLVYGNRDIVGVNKNL